MPENRSRLTARKVRIADVINGSYYTQEGFDPNYVITPYGMTVSRARLLGTVVDTYVNDDESYGAITIDDGTATIRAKFFQELDMMEDIEEGDIVECIGKVKQYDDEIYINPEMVLEREPNYELLRALEIERMREQWRDHVDRVKTLQDADKSEEDIRHELEAQHLTDQEIAGILEYVEMEDEFSTGQEAAAQAQEQTHPTPGATQQPAPTPGQEQSADSGDEDDGADEDLQQAVMEAIDDLDDGDGAEYGAIVEAVDSDEDALEDAINDLLSDGTCYEPRPGRIKKL